ncbi:MAG: hypothetical protein COA99_03590 [Moraxellaceae bacterium]|nr:MAG: hypothetical protein COA99_03590 [Moraxellaceae bacterium]
MISRANDVFFARKAIVKPSVLLVVLLFQWLPLNAVAEWELDWSAETIGQFRYFSETNESVDSVADSVSGSVSSATRELNQKFLDQRYSEQQIFPIINQSLGFSATNEDGDHLFVGDFFFHYDHYDEENRYADIRELSWIYSFGDYQLRAGFSQVSWGVNEIFGIVDVINQLDTQSWPSRTKLGQPLLSLAGYIGDSLLETFVMFDHRQRQFSGENGRLRYPIPIDDKPVYDRGVTGRVDFAVRWQFTLFDTDISLSHFYGVSREPYFTFNFDFDKPRLVPVYEKINQPSIDITRNFGELLVKFEAKYEVGGLQSYAAYAGGVEYTLSGLFGTDFDTTIVFEAVYDTREEANNNILNRDVGLALRVALNDRFDSVVLFAMIQDYEYDERLLLLHWRGSFYEHWRVDAIANVFHSNESAPDRDQYNETWVGVFDDIDSGVPELPVELLSSLIATFSDTTISRRDFEGLIHFIDDLTEPGGYKSSYAETIPDVLFELLSITDKSQKVNLIDTDDYVAISVSYLF